MLKKVMIGFVAFFTLLRGGALGYLMWLGDTNLPTAVLFSTGMVVAIFMVLLAKGLLAGVKRKDIEQGFLFNVGVVLLNMLLVRFGTPANISGVELLVMGNLFEVIAGITLVVLSKRHTRYVLVQRI